MHHTIYRILRDTGRRPGEVVSLRLDCLEIIDGQHNLIYDNHKAGRMRRRLPITTEHRRSDHHLAGSDEPQLPTPPATRPVAVPQPAAARPAIPRTPDRARVGRAFKAWVAEDRHHRLRAARPRRRAGPVRPVA